MGLYHAFFYIYSNFDVDLQYVEREKTPLSDVERQMLFNMI